MNCVVGHPRSGTTLLARMLNAAGTEVCRHEYLFHLSSMAVPVPTDYYAGRASADDVVRLLKHYECTPTPWVRIDSNWKLAWILPVFLSRYPDARVLHLTRDPRDNVRSCHNLEFYGERFDRPQFDRRRYWLSWMPEIRRDDWAALSPFERNCAFWAETHRLVQEALIGHPHTHRLRIEDVRDKDARCQVFEFFGVAKPPGGRDALSVLRPVNAKTRTKLRLRMRDGDTLPSFERWPEVRRARLEEICGTTARRLGYALDGHAWTPSS